MRRAVPRRVARRVGLLLTLVALVAPATVVAGWEVDETATVTRVIDGDTFDSSPTGRVRLADIDAPEYYEPGYEAAADFLSSLIDGRLAYLDVDDVYGTDIYGRTVAVVYVRHDDLQLRNVNKALLDAGVADVADYSNEFNPATWTSYVFYPVDAPPPTVTASASPIEGFVPLTVAFSSTASGGIPPYAFAWAFGDGGTSAVQSPSHTYVVAGTYRATLAVTDAARRSTTTTVQVTARASLSVVINAQDADGPVPLTVTFRATAAGGTPPYSFHWGFGDNTTGDSPDPSHSYASPGTYAVTVTVTDAETRTAASSVEVRVSEPSPPPNPPLPPSGSNGPPGVLPYLAILIAAAVAGTLIILRRRRHRSSRLVAARPRR